MFDVAALMEDSETKTAALEKVAELEEELGHVSSIPTFFSISSIAYSELLNWKAVMVEWALIVGDGPC